jgi:hypothetical protein
LHFFVHNKNGAGAQPGALWARYFSQKPMIFRFLNSFIITIFFIKYIQMKIKILFFAFLILFVNSLCFAGDIYVVGISKNKIWIKSKKTNLQINKKYYLKTKDGKVVIKIKKANKDIYEAEIIKSNFNIKAGMELSFFTVRETKKEKKVFSFSTKKKVKVLDFSYKNEEIALNLKKQILISLSQSKNLIPTYQEKNNDFILGGEIKELSCKENFCYVVANINLKEKSKEKNLEIYGINRAKNGYLNKKFLIDEAISDLSHKIVFFIEKGELKQTNLKNFLKTKSYKKKGKKKNKKILLFTSGILLSLALLSKSSNKDKNKTSLEKTVLYVDATPEKVNADIYINDVLTNKTTPATFENLEPGTYKIKVYKNPNWTTYETTVILNKGSYLKILATLEQNTPDFPPPDMPKK